VVQSVGRRTVNADGEGSSPSASAKFVEDALRVDAPEIVRVEDRAVLEPLAQRGLAAHERLRTARAALAEARRAEDAAGFELAQAEREFVAVNWEITSAGYHDTGHIVGWLKGSVPR
jgi:hypothetical protein